MVGRVLAPALAAFATIVAVADATATARAPFPTPRPAPAAVPPDLQALERKMLALRLRSERFSSAVSVVEKAKVKGPLGGFNHVFGRASGLAIPLITVAGEFSLGPPPEASFTLSFLGITTSARLIGSTLYTHEPFVSRLDGGRPWVEERNTSLARALGSQPAGPVGAAEPGASFKTLAKLIGYARSIAELGPASVDGQPVTRFELAIPFAALQKPGRSRGARARARRQRKLFAPLLHVELFLAETGLPVRTGLVVVLRHGKGELIVHSDITAVDVPVLVQAPPVAETITASELKRVIRRHVRRMAAKRRAAGRRIVAVHRMRRGHARSPQK